MHLSSPVSCGNETIILQVFILQASKFLQNLNFHIANGISNWYIKKLKWLRGGHFFRHVICIGFRWGQGVLTIFIAF